MGKNIDAQQDVWVEPMASSTLPLEKYGDFVMTVFRNSFDDAEHFILEKRPFGEEPLVRVHSECITGDLFGSLKCDCGHQLAQSLRLISQQGGILIYLRQEGRGIGLTNKLKAYALQEQGLDTVEANRHLGLPIDDRDYVVAAEILASLQVKKIRLLTNNPQKIEALAKKIQVIERIPLESKPTEENRAYLQVKQEKLGHLLTFNK